MANKVENTETASKENPLRTIVQTMHTGGIEEMEARGTTQLAESSVLPSDGLVKEKTVRGDRAEWAAKCGIKILDLVDGDDIFVNVEMPAGWKQERTDHGMWNSLVDEKGRKRASIFYKAAFYDRSAFIQPVSRFRASYGCDFSNYEDKRCWAIVEDGGKEIWRGEILEPGPSPWNPDSGPCMQMETAAKQAREWLGERYPDHEDCNAYWD